MKILFIDTFMDGHHLPYLRNLVRDNDILLLPKKINEVNNKQYILCESFINKTYKEYRNIIKQIVEIANKEKPDIIHFLYGDAFYKFFGLLLFKLKKFRTVLTMHWIKPSFLHHISLFRISRKINYIVVHSEYLKQECEKIHIKNVKYIEYPQFYSNIKTKKEGLVYFSLKKEVPVISAIGGTREDKGIDILLNALKHVDKPFQLLIAGKPDYFTEDYINEEIKTYESKVTKVLHYLTDEELLYAFAASDIIVIPYRKTFSGASGPLTEGVWNDKIIIGPNFGNIGYTIAKNHLGITFLSENPESLANSLNFVIEKGFNKDKLYYGFKERIKIEYFVDDYNKLYSALKIGKR